MLSSAAALLLFTNFSQCFSFCLCFPFVLTYSPSSQHGNRMSQLACSLGKKHWAQHLLIQSSGQNCLHQGGSPPETLHPAVQPVGTAVLFLGRRAFLSQGAWQGSFPLLPFMSGVALV